MAVALRSQGAAAATTSTSLTLTMPTGVQSGDYLIAFIHCQSSSATVDIASSGWTRVNAAFSASNVGTRVTGMYAKFAGSSEPSTYAFSNPATSARIVGFITAYTGVDTTTPVAAVSAADSSSSTQSSLNVTANAAAANLYTLELWAANFASPNSYALSSYTGGLTFIGDGFNPAGAENTTVSRSALRVWGGTAPSGGLPAHVVTTTGSSAQATVSTIALVAAGSPPPVTSNPPVLKGFMPYRSNGGSSTFAVDPNFGTISGSTINIGDWMIAVFSCSQATGLNVPTPSAGWTNIVPLAQVGTAGTMAFGVWVKQRLVGETSYTWSQSTGGGSTHHRILWVSGAQDVSQWTIGSFVPRETNASGTTTQGNSVTTTTANTLAINLSGERTVAAETDSQISVSNFTKNYFDNSSDASLTVSSKVIATASATGIVTTTYPNSHVSNGIAGIIVLPPVPSSTPSGLSIKVSNGSTLVDAKFKLADGAGGLVNPGGYKVLRPGYSTVTQMLAQNKFYCAHRGGSRDFPEMSLYAYGQSALVGYPALEISLARTSDGVWFGLHDASLDRTSFNTGGGSGTTYVASTMTWAQVQTYSILGSMAANNTTQANRPYMRWEELMTMYYPSHVIFVDPKVASANITELLNMMDAMPGTPTDHFVAKYYGVSGGASNASGWNKEAKLRGYKTWGYFYETDSANFVTYAPRWDILGMDYSASQTAWNDLAAAAPGKPIMGHICPDAAAVATATSKGAVGYMVSGVKANVPPAIT